MYQLAGDLAGDWMFLRSTADELNDVLAAVTRLFLTAGFIERTEQPDER